MSDDYNVSYSYQAGSAPTTPAPQEQDELVAFVNCEIIKLDNSSVLLLNRDNGTQTAVAPEVATALTYCTTFRTLQDHAQVLVDTIPQLNGQLANVRQVLTMVHKAGLMLEADTIRTRLAPGTQAETALPPSRAFIITCDRPAAVERLLDSLLQTAHPRRHDELFLVDDSREADNCHRNRELVAKFNRSSPKDMRYLGATAQRQLMERLIAAEPEQEQAIRFLIDRERWTSHQTYGLSRTLCLLLSVGYRCIVLDDDVLCRTVLPPAQDRGITFGGGANRELACFGSEQALMAQAAYGDTDPLTGHARCLGMPLARALQELGEADIAPDSLRDTNATMLSTLQADSPILVTQCGSWGDPGTPGNSWFTHLGESSIRRVLAAPGGLTGAMQNRHYWLGRSRANIGKMAMMSQATGLDNSALLPPYFPAYRGEDYLFASMLLYLHPGSAVLDYNWSVPHLPLEQREGGKPEQVTVPRGGLGLCATYLADRVEYEHGVSPETRLQRLAMLLKELGEREPASLLAEFRGQLAQKLAGELRQLNTQLQAVPAHGDASWESFLQQSRRELSAALQSSASPMDMPDAPQELGEEDILRQIKAGIGAFGQAIGAWPGLRKNATTITRQLLDGSELTP